MIPYHKPLDIEVDFTDIFESGMLTNDKYCRILENKIERMYNVDYVLATSSCTMGLMLCIKYKKPSYLQTTMFEWWSIKYLLDFLKQDLVWCDIENDTWLPIEKYRGLCLYLHTFGNVGIANHPDYTIFDASHCLGVKLNQIGLASVFSLAPTKLITSCEGGLILTNNEKLYNQCKEWRDRMCRMSEIHAKVGLETLKSIDKILKWKKKVFEYYKKNISGVFQEIPNNSNYNTIGFLNLEKLKIPEEIETKQYYEPIYDRRNSNTQFVFDNIVCLPSFHGVDYKKVVELIQDAN